MSWCKIDDGAPDHPKFLAAGGEASWYWVCGLAYCNKQKNRTGFIPAAKALVLFPAKNPRTLVKALVDAKLWREVDGGYQMHDYEEWNGISPTLSAARAEAGRRGGSSRSKQEANGEAKAKQLASEIGSKQPSNDGANAKQTSRARVCAGDLPIPTPTPTPGDPPHPPAGGEPRAEPPSAVRMQAARLELETQRDGAFGMTADAWTAGISAATGAPCSRPDRGGVRELQRALQAHAGGRTGEGLLEWVRASATTFARTNEPRFGGYTVRRWKAWLDAGSPKADPKRQGGIHGRHGPAQPADEARTWQVAEHYRAEVPAVDAEPDKLPEGWR